MPFCQMFQSANMNKVNDELSVTYYFNLVNENKIKL